MTRMHLRRKVAAVAIGAVALASTAGAAAAADSGAAPTGKGTATTKVGVKQGPDAKGKGDGKPKPDPKTDKEIAAVAKDLGVTVDQLNDALRATKEWFGTTGTEPTPEAVAAHVGSILHVPAAKVLASFKAHGLFDDKSGGKKPGGGKDRGGNSANIDKAAKDLGVTRAALENALTQTKMWIGSTGAQPTPELIAAHVASILGKNADQVLKVLEADGVLDSAPPTKPKAQA
ncbi:MAG: hypothetical protein HOV87_06165 [Catenulispora sp.]|nr:hypothetical protein [Catenulispora sp.]